MSKDNNSYIIGISGELNSGKDTVASIINYIFGVGVSKANYSDWLIRKAVYDDKYKHRIIHFADPMKDCLSIMYNIPREYFDSREHKDELWYVINGRRFITEKDTNLGHCYRITIDLLKEYTLDYLIEKHPKYTIVIKLRTLMQYFGTEVVRNMMGAKLWTNSTMFKAADIAETYKVCIIPDVRFSNEHNAIKGNSLYGGDVYVSRDSTKKGGHDSETIDFENTTTIDNNSTKATLFFKVLAYISNLINKH